MGLKFLRIITQYMYLIFQKNKTGEIRETFLKPSFLVKNQNNYSRNTNSIRK